ncbi:MAG: PKD domain-containing protein [Acidobacteria bacterium]|nr:PKD domain-containing protein [Acidobacteriota bacterium]
MKKVIIYILLAILFISWSEDTNENSRMSYSWLNDFAKTCFNNGETLNVIWKSDYPRAQSLDRDGNVLWSENGVVVGDCAVPDLDGGIISATASGSSYTIKRINHRHQQSWQHTITGPSSAISEYVYLGLVSDENGGAIVVTNYHNGSTGLYEVRVRKYNHDGGYVWDLGLTGDAGSAGPLKAVSDGFGGVYYSRPGTGGSVYIDHINSNASTAWSSSISSLNFTFPNYLIADGSGGVIYVGEQAASGVIYAGKLSSAAANMWGAGTHVFNSSDYHVVSDGQGGIFAGSHTRQSIFAQRVNSAGTALWGTEGRRVVTGKTAHCRPTMVSAGAEGALLFWPDNRNFDLDIYGQKISSDGRMLWDAAGVPICTAKGDQFQVVAERVNSGGTLVSWSDFRNLNNYDVYAQKVCDNGTIGYCLQDFQAVIKADRYGGVSPVTINFDGSDSVCSKSEIISWYWDFGDGSDGAGEQITHTYSSPGRYEVTLTVTSADNCKSIVTEEVLVFGSADEVRAEVSLSPSQIKAYGNESSSVYITLYKTATNAVIGFDLGISTGVSTGTLEDELVYVSGLRYYRQALSSGDPGTATLTVYLDGVSIGSGEISYLWPQPPVNFYVNWNANRGLFQGQFSPELEWNPNTTSTFEIVKYRIYRADGSSNYKLIAEVESTVLTYSDQMLSSGINYSYYITAVDSEGDESDPSDIVTSP